MIIELKGQKTLPGTSTTVPLTTAFNTAGINIFSIVDEPTYKFIQLSMPNGEVVIIAKENPPAAIKTFIDSFYYSFYFSEAIFQDYKDALAINGIKFNSY